MLMTCPKLNLLFLIFFFPLLMGTQKVRLIFNLKISSSPSLVKDSHRGA